MPIRLIDNHADRMAGLLIQQFKDSPRLNALVRALGEMAQDLEGAAWDTSRFRNLSSAYGQQLDGLGEILGEPRFGRSDEVYRLWLYFRIFINTSKGRPEDMIEVCRFVTNEGAAGGDVKYWENWPASLQLFTDGLFIPGTPDPDDAVDLELDDGDTLELSDGDTLEVQPGKPEEINSLVDILKSIAPVAVGILPVAFSLGVYPFGMGGDFVPSDFELSDGDALEFDDGDTLAVQAGDQSENEWGFFSEIVTEDLELDDGDALELDTGDILALIDGGNPAFDTTGAGGLIDVIQG